MAAVVVALVAIGVAQIVTHHGLVRRQPLGLEIFRDGSVKALHVVQEQSQVVMCLPQLRVQRNRLPVRGCGCVNVALVAKRDSQVVVHVGIIGVAGKGFVESMDCRRILSVAV